MPTYRLCCTRTRQHTDTFVAFRLPAHVDVQRNIRGEHQTTTRAIEQNDDGKRWKKGDSIERTKGPPQPKNDEKRARATAYEIEWNRKWMKTSAAKFSRSTEWNSIRSCRRCDSSSCTSNQTRHLPWMRTCVSVWVRSKYQFEKEEGERERAETAEAENRRASNTMRQMKFVDKRRYPWRITMKTFSVCFGVSAVFPLDSMSRPSAPTFPNSFDDENGWRNESNDVFPFIFAACFLRLSAQLFRCHFHCWFWSIVENVSAWKTVKVKRFGIKFVME